MTQTRTPTRQRVVHGGRMSGAGPTIRLVMGTRAKVYVVVGVLLGVAARLLGMDPHVSLAVAIVAPILLAAMPRFLLATVKGALTASPREAGPTTAMTGMEFEDHVAHI